MGKPTVVEHQNKIHFYNPQNVSFRLKIINWAPSRRRHRTWALLYSLCVVCRRFTLKLDRTCWVQVKNWNWSAQVDIVVVGGGVILFAWLCASNSSIFLVRPAANPSSKHFSLRKVSFASIAPSFTSQLWWWAIILWRRTYGEWWPIYSHDYIGWS